MVAIRKNKKNISNDNIEKLNEKQTDEQPNKRENTEMENDNNGWTRKKNLRIEIFMQKLKHNRPISNFFYFELKSTESRFSWWLIILSSLSTTLPGLNNLEDEPFDHFFLSIQASLGTFSVLTTLIAAWMKKQQYVDRINEIDRYVQKITQLIE